MAKKFSDTKFGSWVKNKLPDAAQTIANELPDSGWMGLVKNLITNHDTLPPEDKIEGLKLANEFELSMEHEMTTRIVEAQKTEQIQIAQEDKWTKRARPTRQYAWVIFLFVCYPVAWFAKDKVVDVPTEIVWGIFADFGYYTYSRTMEKIKKSR